MALFKKTITVFAASIWLINGLFCKLFNLVPRHQQIVARILGNEHAIVLTKIIGGLEILMAVWILSKIQPRLCTATQIVLVATMNVIEFYAAPDLLLFGKANILVAAVFILILIFNHFFNRKQSPVTFKP